jgi:RNA-directed DNA polymerase
MLEKAIVTTRCGEFINVQYARFADDLVILIDAHPRHDWLVKAVNGSVATSRRRGLVGLKDPSG